MKIILKNKMSLLILSLSLLSSASIAAKEMSFKELSEYLTKSIQDETTYIEDVSKTLKEGGKVKLALLVEAIAENTDKFIGKKNAVRSFAISFARENGISISDILKFAFIFSQIPEDKLEASLKRRRGDTVTTKITIDDTFTYDDTIGSHAVHATGNIIIEDTLEKIKPDLESTHTAAA